MNDKEFLDKWNSKLKEIEDTLEEARKFEPDNYELIACLQKELSEKLAAFSRARKRRAKEIAMDSIGMKKVRGNLGGSYYE